MRKIIALGIMLLFIGMTISSSTGLYLEKQSIKPMSSGNILYVGGNGTGNYSSIQDAIDDASNGDTVFVYDGTYYENLEVDKSINLIGEDRNTTVIDAGRFGDVIFISANRVTITGFTIQNGGINNSVPDNVDAGIDIRSNYNIIIGNIITNNVRGVLLIYCTRNNIDTNIITNNKEIGIHVLEWARHNRIFGNLIEDTEGEYYGYGICLGYAFHNTVSRNTIRNHTVGIEIDGSVFNIISENHMTNNREYGVRVALFFLNIVRKNNFIENENNAFFLGMFFSSHTIWFRNYWDDWIGVGPKCIQGWWVYPLGGSNDIPWVQFDWHPAQEPYDIGV